MGVIDYTKPMDRDKIGEKPLDTKTPENDGPSRGQRFLSGMKNAGNKAVIGTAAIAGAAAGAAAGGFRKATQKVSVKTDGGGSGEINNSQLNILFLLALFAHVWDFATEYDRPFGAILFFYVIILIYAYFFVFERRIGGDEGALLIVIVASFLLPMACDWFTESNFMILLSGLIFLIPLLPMYIAFKFPDNSFINKIFRWYLVFWIIVCAFYMLTMMSTTTDAKSMIKNPAAGVKAVFIGVGNVFDKTFTTFENTFNEAIARATGQPYDGNEESRVGIYVENVKPFESRYNSNSRVYVQAHIRAVNVKEPIKITTLCHIDGLKQGATTPSVINDVVGNYDNIIQCELGTLPPGQHNVKVQADFEFSGSSDIEYVFVNADIKNDQYTRLGIQPSTTATYTGGPVALGLPSLTQPLRVYVDDIYDDRNEDTLNYPFGISLENRWPQGKVVRGIQYILDTPSEIKLIDCTRDPASTLEPNNNGRNEYTFSMNTSNAQESFDAVQCRMYASDINMLLSNDANVRTFAGKAKYEYIVEASTIVNVER